MHPAFSAFAISADSVLFAGSVMLAVTIAAGLGLLLATLLRRRSAPVRYALMLAALSVAVMSPLLTTIAQRAKLSMVEVPRAAVLPAVAPSLPAFTTSATLNNAPATWQEGLQSATVAVQQGSRPAIAWWQWGGLVLLVVWGAGTIVCLLRLLVGIVRLRRFMVTIVPCDDPVAVDILRRSAALMGLTKLPALRQSNTLPVPMVMGLFRPRIVLPQRLRARLDSQRLEAVLLHELAHVAHNDLWVGLFQRIAAAMLWWCPLVHVLNRRISDLREEICDNYVLTVQGDGLSLAEVLMGLAAERRRPAWMLSIGAMGVVDERPGLAGRIERLIHNQRSTMTRMNRIALLGTACFAMFVGGAILATTLRAADAKLPTVVDRLAQVDFWTTLGGLSPTEWKKEDKQLREIAANEKTPTAVRLRATRLLVELDGKLRVSIEGIKPDAVTRSLSASMAYLEANLEDATVRKFSPASGFTHVTVSRKARDGEHVWVLIESIDPARRGGLNIAVLEATGKVVAVDHWGKVAADAQAADFSIDMDLKITQGDQKREVNTAVQGKFAEQLTLAGGKHTVKVVVTEVKKNAPDAGDQQLVEVRITDTDTGNLLSAPRLVVHRGEPAMVAIGGKEFELVMKVTVKVPPAKKVEKADAARHQDPSEAFFARFDTDHNGSLSFAELDAATAALAATGGKFLGRFEPHRYTWLSPDARREAEKNFAAWDQDGDGAISYAESQRQIPGSLPAGDPASRTEQERYMTSFDENRDGRVTFEEVVVSQAGAPFAGVLSRFSQIPDSEIERLRRTAARP